MRLVAKQRQRRPSSVVAAALSTAAVFAFAAFLAVHLVPHISASSSSSTLTPVTPHSYANASYKLLQQDVRHVTRVLYRAYMRNCMGYDEFEPLTGKCYHWFNIGLSALDSLDTLLIMDLQQEYHASRDWAASSLRFDQVSSTVSLFELVIRAMGGMNSAYELSGDSLWLNHSVRLADMLLHAFDITPTKCPPPAVFIGDHIQQRMREHPLPTYSTASEVGTLQLEFRTLSRFSKDPRYKNAVDHCMKIVEDAYPDDSLVPPFFDLSNGKFHGERLTIGGSVDSLYEMLAKNWVMSGRQDGRLRSLFERSVEAITQTLSRSNGDNLYIGEMRRNRPGSFRKHMDHLACFFPGTLAYAALHGLGGGVNGTGEHDYMPLARRLTRSCFNMTRGVESGLAGEITLFVDKPVPKSGHDVNYLRPEIVEALYYMDQIDPLAGGTYKQMGREMWQSIRRWAQIAGKEDGLLSTTYGLLGNNIGVSHGGKLHSFVLAETLKYFYLLFDERSGDKAELPLTEWVFNTEAHPHDGAIENHSGWFSSQSTAVDCDETGAREGTGLVLRGMYIRVAGDAAIQPVCMGTTQISLYVPSYVTWAYNFVRASAALQLDVTVQLQQNVTMVIIDS
ncbi:mannosyl-oligosaccharide--1,2-mannosidase [Gracilaria domingensis]|nr:mannosyl-oligosaccharide--1,2-mannosidase [Gracilaria domingensis]